MDLVNVLVTGSKGQLGNELQLLAKAANPFRFTFVDIEEMDLTREDSIRSYFEDKTFHYIINTAAYTDVERAEREESLAFSINAHAVSVMAAICRERDTRLIHVSTDYVLDGQGNRPIAETAIPNPLSAYGRSKLEGEKLIQSLLSNAYIIRTSWLYSNFGKNFVKTILRLASERTQLDVIADQVGSPTYARDLGLAIMKVLDSVHSRETDIPGIYHYANEGVASWYDLAYSIIRIKGLSCNVRAIRTDEYPTSVTRPQYSVLDKRKISTTFQVPIPHWYDSLVTCLRNMDKVEGRLP